MIKCLSKIRNLSFYCQAVITVFKLLSNLKFYLIILIICKFGFRPRRNGVLPRKSFFFALMKLHFVALTAVRKSGFPSGNRGSQRLLERGNAFFATPISQGAYGFPLLQKYRLGGISSFLRNRQNYEKKYLSDRTCIAQGGSFARTAGPGPDMMILCLQTVCNGVIMKYINFLCQGPQKRMQGWQRPGKSKGSLRYRRLPRS